MSTPSQPLPIQTPFVGRKREQRAYQQLLTQATPWVLIITGQGGQGKSTLLRYLAEQTPPGTYVVTLNFANESLRTDPLNILEHLSWQLASCCDPQRTDTFERTLQEGRDRLSAFSGQMKQEIHIGDYATFQGQGMQLNISAAMREQRRQVRETVIRAFYHQLLTFNLARLVLMLDTCEWLSELEGLEVGQWVMDELLPGIHQRMQQRHLPCSVVLAGRMSPPLTVIERQEQWPLPLPMLEQPAVDQYLEQVGMQDPALRQRVYEITHGHALCVSIIGTLWQEQGDSPLTLADLPKLQERFNEAHFQRS